jgi:hypothetical protein
MIAGMKSDRPIDRLDPQTRRIMERLVNTPPEPHKAMPKKRGGAKAAPSPRRKGSCGAV